MTRVLVVTHDASLTGAPMVALLVARCLVENGDDVQVISRRKGPLLADFVAVAPTRREMFSGVRRRLWLARPLARLAWWVDAVCAALTLARHRPDVIYLNTSASAIYLHGARWLRLAVTLHVHESDANTETLLAQARARDLTGVRLIACSPSVHAHLVARTGRAPEEVALLPSVPDDRRVRERVTALQGTEGSLTRSGLRVGAVGSVGHRKGTDLWLQVAALVQECESVPETTFVWIGDLPDDFAPDSFPGVEFTGPLANPYPLIAEFDVLTLPSRDDPFPLVVLEAMLLGTPVVAFDVGSVRDQVGDGGTVVAPGDVDDFARAVHHLLTDEEVRHATGSRARARAERLYSTSAFARRLHDILAEPGPSGQPPRTAARQSR